MDNYNGSHSKQQDAKWFAENLEWAAWGHVLKTTVTHSGSGDYTTEEGYYLMGYKLKGENPHLFWGPGVCSWTHRPKGSDESLVGKEYGEGTQTETGGRGPAGSWMGSWWGNGGVGKGLMELGCISNVGEVIIGVYGKTIIPAEGGCPGSTKCDLIFFKISSNSFGGFCSDNQRSKFVGNGLPYDDQAIFWINVDSDSPSIYFGSR